MVAQKQVTPCYGRPFSFPQAHFSHISTILMYSEEDASELQRLIYYLAELKLL